MAAAPPAKPKRGIFDEVKINPGLTALWPSPDEPQKSGEEPVADIIAVPGLGANPEYSFRHSAEKVDWLKDKNMLHDRVKKTNIWIFGYDSQWMGKSAIDAKLTGVAIQLLRAIVVNRPKSCTRPIVFIAHSLGGVVLERALILARNYPADYPNVFTCTVGCVFLGAPFRGTKTAEKARLLAQYAHAFGLGEDSGLVKVLEERSEVLSDMLQDFTRFAREVKMHLFCFYELRATDLLRTVTKRAHPKMLELVVDELSATIDGERKAPLSLDHFDLNKYTGPKDGNFLSVANEIGTIVQNAPGIMKSRKNAMRQHLVDDTTFYTVLSKLTTGKSDPEEDMKKSLQGRPGGSDSWALSTDSYKTWKTSNSSNVLWVHGGAGKGHAVIASSFIKQLKEEVGKDESKYIGYFFSSEKDPNRRSATDLLKLLARQIIFKQRDLTDYLLGDQKDKKKGDELTHYLDSIKPAALWTALRNIFHDPAVQTVYFLVNAFDETDKESQQLLFDILNPYLAGDPTQSDADGSVVKWIFLSRSGRREIDTHFASALTIDIDDDENTSSVNAELKSYISRVVDDLALRKGYNLALAYFVKRHIFTRAEGNYLYVDLMIQELRNLEDDQSSHSEIRKFLESHPYGLTEMFEHIRKRVLDPARDDIEYTKEILRCLILAQRAPSPYELAMMADFPSDDVDDYYSIEKRVARCGGFVTITEYDDATVEFINIAAKEHLEAYAADQLGLNLPELQAVQHAIMALRCLDWVYGYYSTQAKSEEQDAAREAKRERGQDTEVDEEPALDAADASVTQSPIDGLKVEAADEAATNEDEPHLDDNDDENKDGDATSEHEDNHTEGTAEPADDYVVVPYRLDYAIDYWMDHAKLAEEDFVDEIQLYLDFWAALSPLRDRWWKDWKESDLYEEGLEDLTPLHIAAVGNYFVFADHLLKNGMEDEIHALDSEGYQPLYRACENGAEEIAQRLVEAGADINHRDSDKHTVPLWAASTFGFLDLVKYLINVEADVNVNSDEDGSPLYEAVSSGHKDVVDVLLGAGAKPNLVGGFHRRAINVAAYEGNLELVETLLQHHADVDPEEEYQYGSALGAAARKGHIDIVRLLLHSGWNANRKGGTYGTPLVAASTYGHEEVVKILLETDPNTLCREQALRMASRNGHVEVVKLILHQSKQLRHEKAFMEAASYGRDEVLELLKACGVNQKMLDDALYDASDKENESTVALLLKMGASPNAEGEEYGTALTASAYDGTEGILQLLLDAGADPNKRGGQYGTALQAACYMDKDEIVDILLAHNAQVNTEAIGKWGSALQAACFAGCVPLVTKLLDHNADVNVYGGEYSYPILAAANEANSSLVELLVNHGADVNVPDPETGSSPLIIAGFLMPKGTMELLLEHGANLEAVNKKGETVLITTATTGDTDGLEFLLDYGANVHATSEERGTALHAAASNGDEAACELLLKWGASVNAEGGKHHTALQEAAWDGDFDTVKVLLDRHADVHMCGGEFGTALQAAAISGNKECLEAIIQAGADVNQLGGKYGTALQAAAFEMEFECLKVLLDHNANVNIQGGEHNTALQAAAVKRYNWSCVEKLLEVGADLHLYGGDSGSIMQALAWGNNMEMWEEHFKDKIRLDLPGGHYGNALQAAIIHADQEFVEKIIETGVDVNAYGGKYGTALQAAAYKGNEDIARILINRQADVRIIGGRYHNALNAAVVKGRTKIVFMFIDIGLPEQMLDEALIQAVYHKQPEVVAMLLKNEASVSAYDPKLGTVQQALGKKVEEEPNSDDEEEDNEEEDEEEDEEEEQEGEEDEEVGSVAGESASVASDDLKLDDLEPTPEEKIRKLLSEHQAKLRRNPTVTRFQSVRRKQSVRRNQGQQGGPPLPVRRQYLGAGQQQQQQSSNGYHSYQPYQSPPQGVQPARSDRDDYAQMLPPHPASSYSVHDAVPAPLRPGQFSPPAPYNDWQNVQSVQRPPTKQPWSPPAPPPAPSFQQHPASIQPPRPPPTPPRPRTDSQGYQSYQAYTQAPQQHSAPAYSGQQYQTRPPPQQVYDNGYPPPLMPSRPPRNGSYPSEGQPPPPQMPPRNGSHSSQAQQEHQYQMYPTTMQAPPPSTQQQPGQQDFLGNAWNKFDTWRRN